MTDATAAFARMAPFIKEYIYRQRWDELRPVQVAAAHGVLDTFDHVLLASATASGKTEAAFFPILTLLHQRPSTSVAVLYIGPLKALINDQFGRLEPLLQEAGLPVTPWHGDAPLSLKRQLVAHPSGVLQITPESLESLLMNHTAHVRRMFGDLRFVVIDEVHAFMGTDRGGQVLCQLQRLDRATRVQPRRIGLSATLGDYAAATRWLATGTQRAVYVPDVGTEKRTVRIAMEHFYEYANDEDHVGSHANDPVASWSEYVFDRIKDRKALIFANRREDVERVVADLRYWSNHKGRSDLLYAHHGNVAASLRQEAEQAMREADRPVTVAATVTLELGVDIGQLERVIQLDAPPSAASFVQRLGRSGRATAPAEMWFVCRESALMEESTLLEQIPWGLLQAIAVVEVYRTERFVEPQVQHTLPYSLLYHQTMSTLMASGELSPRALARQVLTLGPFVQVTQADYRLLLRHLLDLDHLALTPTGGLMIGLAGERVVRDFHFYAVFADVDEFRVIAGTAAVGTLTLPPAVGEKVALAGRNWLVIDVDERAKVIYVESVRERADASFIGRAGDVHERIVREVRHVLTSADPYPYLQTAARARLQEAREVAHAAHLGQRNVVKLAENTYAVFPWKGSKAGRTLARYVAQYGPQEIGVYDVQVSLPYVLIVQATAQLEEVAQWLADVGREGVDVDVLVKPSESLLRAKFDAFVPDELLRKAFVADELEEWI